MARSRVYRNRRMRTPEGKAAWCMDYEGLDGVRHRERTTASTKEEVTALLRAKLAEIAKAKAMGVAFVGATSPTTFHEFSREFLAHCKVTNTPETYRRYVSCTGRLLPFFGGRPLATITPGDVERYVVGRRGTVKHASKCKRQGDCGCAPIAPATVNRERAVFSKAMNMATRRGLIDRNPVLAVRPLKENNARDRYLEPMEESRLLEVAEEWLRPIILMGLQTGMRLGEILSMRRGDIDGLRRMLRVPKTKNGKVRHVPLNAVAMAVLNGVPPYIGESSPSPLVFVNPSTGKAYRVTSVGHAFQRAVKAAALATEGADRVTFHTLRHTVVSRLVAAGVPDRKIMKLVGHSSAAMVSRYAHLSPDGLRDAADILARPTISSEKGTPGAQNRASNVVAM